MAPKGASTPFPSRPTAEQAGLLIEALSSGIKAGGAVIAIVPDWFAPEGLQRLEMARALLDTARVAIHVTSLPPLAATALASLASSLGPRLPCAGLLASALPGLSEQLHQITWLGSVTGLKHPAPSLGQHVTSLTPGSAFGVSSHPEPAVHKLQSGQPSVPLPRIVRASRLAVAPATATSSGSPARSTRRSATCRSCASSRRPAARSTGGRARSSRRSSSRPTRTASPSELMQSVDAWACRWCGELIARSPCPLCGHRARPRRRPRRLNRALASRSRAGAPVGRRRGSSSTCRARSSAARRTS